MAMPRAGSGFRESFAQVIQERGGSVGPGGMTQMAPTVGMQTQQGSPAFQKMASLFMPKEFPQFTGSYSTTPQQLMQGFMGSSPQGQQIGYHQDGSPYYAPAGMTPEQMRALAAELWNSGQLYQRPQGY